MLRESERERVVCLGLDPISLQGSSWDYVPGLRMGWEQVLKVKVVIVTSRLCRDYTSLIQRIEVISLEGGRGEGKRVAKERQRETGRGERERTQVRFQCYLRIQTGHMST